MGRDFQLYRRFKRFAKANLFFSCHGVANHFFTSSDSGEVAARRADGGRNSPVGCLAATLA